MSSASIGYIGPYRLLNVVNTGQSSRLWQAYDDQTRRFVGIKTLLDRFARQKDQIQILKWEYDVASKFKFPRLIEIYGFDWQQKMPYLVMEWFAAPNMKMWVNRGYGQYCQFLAKAMPEMVEALLYLHEQGWTHRDVKPDNFLMSEEKGEIKLIDFALARRIPGAFGRLIARKAKTQGTASYMSPEQIQGQPPSQAADIYSLGCTFYELLTGRLPFSGETMNDLLRKHLQTLPPAIMQKNKNVTPEFANLLKSMLAKSPEDRPKSTAELMQTMRSVRIFRRPATAEDPV